MNAVFKAIHEAADIWLDVDPRGVVAERVSRFCKLMKRSRYAARQVARLNRIQNAYSIARQALEYDPENAVLTSAYTEARRAMLAEAAKIPFGSSEAIREVVAVLSKYRFRYKNEDELQQGIAQALEVAGIGFSREVRIDAESRLDFLISEEYGEAGVVIETKIHANSSRAQILRQVERYALSAKVRGILVVGTKFIEALPATVNLKPLAYHCLLRSML